ncbi:hypothetical protein, partial [Vibrio campbellii]|uniref:hypothetical protein n=1 Tax=Vibrio campbellii TaxID=680 RepID=UPI001BDA9020
MTSLRGVVSSCGCGGSYKLLSSRRHLLPSVVPLRTQHATFTALGSSLHEGTDWHPATYKAVRAGSY